MDDGIWSTFFWICINTFWALKGSLSSKQLLIIRWTQTNISYSCVSHHFINVGHIFTLLKLWFIQHLREMSRLRTVTQELKAQVKPSAGHCWYRTQSHTHTHTGFIYWNFAFALKAKPGDQLSMVIMITDPSPVRCRINPLELVIT